MKSHGITSLQSSVFIHEYVLFCLSRLFFFSYFLSSFFHCFLLLSCCCSSQAQRGVSHLGISREGYEILVPSNLVKIARIDIFRIFIFISFKLRVFVCTRLLALDMCVTDVIQLAFLVSTIARFGEIGTFKDMSLVTLDTFLAITKKSKRTTDKRAG